jgi:hypothetical protein
VGHHRQSADERVVGDSGLVSDSRFTVNDSIPADVGIAGYLGLPPNSCLVSDGRSAQNPRNFEHCGCGPDECSSGHGRRVGNPPSAIYMMVSGYWAISVIKVVGFADGGLLVVWTGTKVRQSGICS